jgi:hypothetical protein
MLVDIERCLNERIVIWVTTKKQANQIWKDYYEYTKKEDIIKGTWNVGIGNGVEVWLREDSCPSYQDGYNKTYFMDKERNYNASCCLDYEEVLLNKIYECW